MNFTINSKVCTELFFPNMRFSMSICNGATVFLLFFHQIDTKVQSKKLSLLLSFCFHAVLQRLKPLYKQIFGLKGSFVLPYRTLEFPGFCVTRPLLTARKALMWPG